MIINSPIQLTMKTILMFILTFTAQFAIAQPDIVAKSVSDTLKIYIENMNVKDGLLSVRYKILNNSDKPFELNEAVLANPILKIVADLPAGEKVLTGGYPQGGSNTSNLKIIQIKPKDSIIKEYAANENQYPFLKTLNSNNNKLQLQFINLVSLWDKDKRISVTIYSDQMKITQ